MTAILTSTTANARLTVTVDGEGNRRARVDVYNQDAGIAREAAQFLEGAQTKPSERPRASIDLRDRPWEFPRTVLAQTSDRHADGWYEYKRGDHPDWDHHVMEFELPREGNPRVQVFLDVPFDYHGPGMVVPGDPLILHVRDADTGDVEVRLNQPPRP